MFACRITGNNDGQKFVRTYYETVNMDHNEFRGAAKHEHLKAQLPDDAFVSVYISDKGVSLAQAKGKEEPVALRNLTRGGQYTVFQVGDLEFKAELLEFPEVPDSDTDEGAKVFENESMTVTRRGNGILITHKHYENCSLYVASSNEFWDRLNVIPGENVDVRVTNAKERPMIQFVPGK